MDYFDWYRLFKTLHVLSVMLLAGAIAIESAIGPMMQKMGTTQELRVLTRLGKVAENYIQIPAIIGLLVFGYATADRANLDLGVTWLLLGQILAYIALAVAIFYLRAMMLKAEKAAEAAPDGPVPDDLRKMVSNPLPGIVGTLLLVIFIFIVYLMVAKPGW